MGKIISFASAKGGTGKSILASNIAAKLAKSGNKVLLADLCPGIRTLDLFCGTESIPAYNFYDLARGECDKDDAIVKHDTIDSLYLLFAPQTLSIEEIDKDRVKDLFNVLKNDYDYIITDSMSISFETFEKTAIFADSVIIVTEADTISARTAEKTALFAEKAKIKENFIIINKISIDLIEKSDIIYVDTFVNTIGGTLIGVVPYDTNCVLATNNCKLVESGDFSDVCNNIARRIKGEKVPVLLKRKTGVLNKLFKR